MSELTNVFARNMRDLTTPTSTGVNPNTFDNAKIPIGNAPQGFESTEALTVKQIKDLAAVDIESKVEVALSNLSTTANKYYPTLSEANSHLATMSVNSVVTIGEEANKGLWYKATAGATTLTKSAYDPLAQANHYTNNYTNNKAIATKNEAVAIANNYTDLVFDAVPAFIAPYVAQAEAAATAATISADVFDTPEAGVDPTTGVEDGEYFNVRSPSSDSYIDEYQNISGVATPSGKSYPSSAYMQDAVSYIIRPFRENKVYPINARVLLENGDIVKSTIDGNTNNPNFDMTGWIHFISSALSDGYAYVEWFGDTTIDATNAINMCLLYCQTYNKVAKSIHGKTYPCSSTVRISTSCDFTGSTFVFPASIATAAVDIRKEVSGSSVLLQNVRIKLPIITNNRTYGTVPVAGSIGVKITGLRDSEVIFNSVQGFENNLQLYSNDVNVYISYNDFRFNGLFASSKVNIHMLIEGQGWINQCMWYGGHFAQYSTDRNAYPAINVKLTKLTAAGNNGPNGHTFIGCAFEGDFYRTIDYDFDPALSVSYYSCNTFLNCRFEAALAIRLHVLALYDTFICCSALNAAVFEGNARPNVVGSPRFTNFMIDVAALVGNVGFRTSKSTHMFQAANSSGAMVVSAAFQNVINGGLLGSGAHVVFNPQKPDLNYPVLKTSMDGGIPSLRMGDGSAEPTESLHRNNVNDWRHTFNLRPTTDNTLVLGAYSNNYANIFSYMGTFKSGIGLFGTSPPSTKRSITGKKAPTTIAEQNAVLNSIVSALVAYGLVSDDRTV